MKSLDLFNSKFEINLHEGAVDKRPEDLASDKLQEHGGGIGPNKHWQSMMEKDTDMQEATARERWNKAADERKKKHDKIEADRQANLKQGKTDVPGAVTRLKQMLTKETEERSHKFKGPHGVLDVDQSKPGVTRVTRHSDAGARSFSNGEQGRSVGTGVKSGPGILSTQGTRRTYPRLNIDGPELNEVNDPSGQIAVHDQGTAIPIASKYAGDGQFKVTIKNKPYIVTIAGWEIDPHNPGELDSFYLTDAATGKTEHVTSGWNYPEAVAIFNNLLTTQKPALVDIYKQDMAFYEKHGWNTGNHPDRLQGLDKTVRSGYMAIPADRFVKAHKDMKKVTGQSNQDLDEKKLGQLRPTLGSARDVGRSVKKFRAQRGLDEGQVSSEVSHRGDVDTSANIEVLDVDFDNDTFKITYNGKPYQVKTQLFSQEGLGRWQIPDYEVDIINSKGKNIIDLIDWNNEGDAKTDRQIRMVNTIIAYLDTQQAGDIQLMAWRQVGLENSTAEDLYQEIQDFYKNDQQKIDKATAWLAQNIEDTKQRQVFADFVKNPVSRPAKTKYIPKEYLMYVAFSYSREGNTELTPGMNLPTIKLTDPDDEEELYRKVDELFKKVQFKFDAFENKIIELADSYGLGSDPDLGSGFGQREMFWDHKTMTTSSSESNKNRQQILAKGILNFRADVEKYVASFNNTLIKIGLPGITEYSTWSGVLADQLTDQQVRYFDTPEGFANLAAGKIDVSKMIDDNVAKLGIQEQSNPAEKTVAVAESQQLHRGDPVVVTAPNEFEGATGEIHELSPSGKFVIVNLYNHGKHSMHLSDVEYNEYADKQEEDDWYDEEEVNESDSLSDIDIMRQDLERMNERQFYSAYGISKVAFQQKYRSLLKPAPEQDTPVKEGTQSEEWTVAIDGNPWKSYPSKAQATKAAKTIEKKYGKKTAVTSAVIQTSQAYNNGQADKWYHRQPGNNYETGTKDYQDYIDGYSGKSFTKQGVAEADPNAPYTPSPAKPFRNPPGFNKQGTGVGNKLAQLNRAELANIQPSKGTPVPANAFVQGVLKDLKKVNVKEVKADPAGSWIVYGGSKVLKFKTHGGAKAYAEKNGGKVASSEHYHDKIQGVKETQTDYQKRRQRERDVDAGKPVPKQREPRTTDYQKKRAQDKKDMALGEGLRDPKDNPCWDKYKPIGTKKKGGKTVPNCVPKESIREMKNTEEVEQAIMKRILVAHKDMLVKFGAQKIIDVAGDVAYNVGDVGGAGKDDVTNWVHQVQQLLGTK